MDPRTASALAALTLLATTIVPFASAIEPPPPLPQVGEGALFGMTTDAKTGQAWFARVDPANGAVELVGALPGVKSWFAGTDTFNEAQNRYYIVAGSADARVRTLFTIDADAGAVLAQAAVEDFRSTEYDPLTGGVYGLRYNAVEKRETLVRVDPDTGSVALVADLKGVDASAVNTNALDVAGQRYFFIGRSGFDTVLVTVDVSDGSFTLARMKDVPTLLEYDAKASTLVGVWWDGAKEWLVRVGGNGALTPVAALPGVAFVTLGSNAFDNVGERYFFGGAEKDAPKLHTVAAATGAIQFAPAMPAVRELEFGTSLEDAICHDVPAIIRWIQIPVAPLIGLLGQTIPLPPEVHRIVVSLGIVCEPRTGGGAGNPGSCGTEIGPTPLVHVWEAHFLDANPAGIVNAGICVRVTNDLVPVSAGAAAGVRYFYERYCYVPAGYYVVTPEDVLRENFLVTC